MRAFVIKFLLFLLPVVAVAEPHSVAEVTASSATVLRGLASATGQTWLGGQIYQLSKGSYTPSELDAESRRALGHGISFQLLNTLLRDEIETVAIGQGAALYASAFPMPSQLPHFVERSTLRDKRSRDLWIMIQFKDGSRANLIADLDPEEIESIYRGAEKRVSRVNGFRVSKMLDSRILFDKLGRKKVSATRAKASKQGQIVVAEFELR